MIAKVFLFCAVVASAKATSFYGSTVIAPRHLDSRQQDFMWAQGIMNPITASRNVFSSMPVGTAVASAFASRSVPISRPLTAFANPNAMSSQRFTDSAQRFTDSPQRFTDSPQRFTDSPQRFTDSPQRFTDSPQRFTESPQRFTDSAQRFTDAPQRFGDSSQRFTDSTQRFADSAQRSIQGTTGLLSGPSYMYSKGLLTNGIMGAASGIVSPMNAGILVDSNAVRNILK